MKSNRSSKAFKVEKFDFIYLNCFPGNSYFRDYGSVVETAAFLKICRKKSVSSSIQALVCSDYGSVVERCIGNAEVAGSIPASRLEFHPLRGE